MNLLELGKDYDATPAQIALAWLLAQKRWIIPIPGTTKIHRLEENLGAVKIKLTESDPQQANNAISKIDVRGHVIRKNCKRWLVVNAIN